MSDTSNDPNEIFHGPDVTPEDDPDHVAVKDESPAQPVAADGPSPQADVHVITEDFPGDDVDLSEIEQQADLPDPDAEGNIPIVDAERYQAGENLDPEEGSNG